MNSFDANCTVCSSGDCVTLEKAFSSDRHQFDTSRIPSSAFGLVRFELRLKVIGGVSTAAACSTVRSTDIIQEFTRLPSQTQLSQMILDKDAADLLFAQAHFAFLFCFT